MSLQQRFHEMRHGFHPTFWIANSLELFERLAYYGATAVLAIYLGDIGLGEEAGTLSGIFSGMIYTLPPLAGVLVDKYGFRKTLMACFLIFSIGYFLIGMAGMELGEGITMVVGKRTYVISVLIFTAIGGSLIKPCIVGTVAKTSTQETKSQGFSIYYTIVNIGGAIGPLLAIPVRENIGIEYVLVTSSITSFLLFLGTFFFFSEPIDSSDADQTELRTFGKVFTDMLVVFTNFKFMAFLIIASGLYIMFWQIFFLLPFYTEDILLFEKFEIIETVDAFCIIFFTVPLAMLSKKLKPIIAIILGFVIATISWLVVGAGGTIATTVVGIGIYAIGESIIAPRFYEYVGSLAPKGQIGTFMGFAFLPVAIGSFVAGPVADKLRASYMETNPAMMW
jgi:dipeptide/tripeptide permease